jgi:membrane associated rhomboid family serine protease
MTAMDQTSLPPPPPAQATERCYRHPDVETGVHCTRCGRPICTNCMVPAPVGHHCPECVAEARKEFKQGPGRRIAVAEARATSVTTLLLIAIGLGYVYEVVEGGAGSLITGPGSNTLVRLGSEVGIWPLANGEIVGIATGQWWRLVTAIFLHGGLIHIALNAYVLWIFGTAVEQSLGRWRTLLIFLVTGIAGSAATYAAQPAIPSVGASGAIFGLFGAFLAYNWRRRDMAMAAARLRAVLPFLIINLVFSFAPGIAWQAHLGGLAAGVLAGFAAEGVGARATRTLTQVLGFALVLAIAIAIVVWKTAELRATLPFLAQLG